MRDLYTGRSAMQSGADAARSRRLSRFAALLAILAIGFAAASSGAAAPQESSSDEIDSQAATLPRAVAPAWATPIIDPMRRAEATLFRGDLSGKASRSQRDAVVRIDEALALLAQQGKKCAGKCSGGGKPKPGGSKPGNTQGSTPAQRAAAATARSPDAPRSFDPEAASTLVKDLWGHLPERQRQQMLQPLSEQFLPEYSTEIEAYFRGLAEPTDSEDAQ